MKRGLIALIEAEIDQDEHPANMEIMNACQNLLRHLYKQTNY